MTAEKKNPAKTIKPNKRTLWLSHFLNESCSTTFMNKKESARRAGYATKNEESLSSIGYENFTKLQDSIATWLDEAGLSENALKSKMLSLLSAKETKFFQKDGLVVSQIDVEAIETQRRTLDMAIKVKGMYAPEKRETTHNLNNKTSEELDNIIKGLHGEINANSD